MIPSLNGDSAQPKLPVAALTLRVEHTSSSFHVKSKLGRISYIRTAIHAKQRFPTVPKSRM